MPAPKSPSPSKPTVTLWGAAGEVTGSRHSVHAAGRQVLLDCGLVMEKHPAARERNAEFPFDPYRIDACLLSHAHLDHSGNLPNLVRQGFAGPIYCTAATRDLLARLLPDSARIQEEDAVRFNALRDPGEPWIEPNYGLSEVEETLERIRIVAFDEEVLLGPGLTARFLPAGHVLGSGIIHLVFTQGELRHRLTYTADLGRRHLPLHSPPAPLPASDLVLCESTYGGQVHEPWPRMLEALKVLTLRTMERGGKLLIPAFSLGRTQLLVFAFQQLLEEKRLRPLPIYVDSPLAAAITEVYQRHVAELAPALAERFGQRPAAFLKGPGIVYVRTSEESKVLNDLADPAVIIASSGMGEGGRILFPLKRWVDDPRSTVLLVSFQAPGTLGARLLERAPTIRIHGKDWNKWADIVALRGFSAHADQADLLAELSALTPAQTRVALVHGQPAQAQALAAALRERGWPDVRLGEYGATLEW
jgi:metallo-beta-lactamase family protein